MGTTTKEGTMIEIEAKIEVVVGHEEMGIKMDHICHYKIMILEQVNQGLRRCLTGS